MREKGVDAERLAAFADALMKIEGADHWRSSVADEGFQRNPVITVAVLFASDATTDIVIEALADFVAGSRARPSGDHRYLPSTLAELHDSGANAEFAGFVSPPLLDAVT